MVRAARLSRRTRLLRVRAEVAFLGLDLSRAQSRDWHGRFSSGGGGGPGAGRDITGDEAAMEGIFAATTEDGSWRVSDLKDEDGRGRTDLAMVELAHRQGFDAKPRVLSDAEFDAVVDAEGHTRLYRGTKGNASATAAEQHAGVRDGDYEPGLGIFGNGYYMAPGRNKAEGFADGTPGSVGRYALHRDARVIEYEPLLDKYGSQIHERRSSIPDATLAVTSDFGRYAASLGYDAIRVPVGTTMIGGSKVHNEEYVILNRGALLAADDGARS